MRLDSIFYPSCFLWSCLFCGRVFCCFLFVCLGLALVEGGLVGFFWGFGVFGFLVFIFQLLGLVSFLSRSYYAFVAFERLHFC